MFSLGTAEARAEGLRAAATLTGGSSAWDQAAVERALATVKGLVMASVTAEGIVLEPRETSPEGWVALGEDTHRVRAALAAEGLTPSVRMRDQKVLLTFE